MTRKFKNKQKSSDITPPKNLGGGVNQGFVSDLWIEYTVAKCRADMFRALTRLDIGVNEVEDYNASVNLKLRSENLKQKGCQGNRDVVRAAMRVKLRDANYKVSEIARKKDKYRREIKSTFGLRSVTTRKILRNFCEEAEKTRKVIREEYKRKINHLRKKFESKKKDNIPDDMLSYKEATVFCETKFMELELEEIEVTVIDDVLLTEDERSVLKLHPKFSVRDVVTIENIEYEQELGYAKVRME